MGLREGEFSDRSLESVNKLITVLTALNTGRPIKIGEYTFKIGETINGGFQPLIKFEVSNSEGKEWVEYMGYQGDIKSFSELCNSLTDEEITLILAENVLNEINKRR